MNDQYQSFENPLYHLSLISQRLAALEAMQKEFPKREDLFRNETWTREHVDDRIDRSIGLLRAELQTREEARDQRLREIMRETIAEYDARQKENNAKNMKRYLTWGFALVSILGAVFFSGDATSIMNFLTKMN
jgi:exonuclease VII large subunit